MISNRRGLVAFTLVELLVAIGIIALLLAILLPTFTQVRAKSRETVCTSNLRQIGHAMLMYSEDNDNRFPYGGDPIDFVHGISRIPGSAGVTTLNPLPMVMVSYITDKNVWHCPSDIGFAMGGRSENIAVDTRPSSFDRYGSSYYYYTQLALKQYPMSTLIAHSKLPPNAERGPADIVALYDGSGTWHGGWVLQTRRYVSLFVDGHVKTLDRADFADAFNIAFGKF